MLCKTMIIGGGVLSIGMAVFHWRFPAIFDWKNEFDKIGQARGRIHYTVNLALLLYFTGFGLLSFWYADELSRPAGIVFGLLVMLSLFWLWRTVWQLVYFKELRGAKTRGPVIMHYVLTVVFGLLTVLYSYPILNGLR